MTDLNISGEDFLNDVPDVLKGTPITPQMGIAAIALNYALKYADIATVQDGQLYQQYKLEGKNMHGLHLDEVFHWAAQIEKHLLETPSRLALMVMEAVAEDIDAAVSGEGEAETDVEPSEDVDQ